MRLALFDIDGTLINTDGAGSRAFSGALESVLGIPDGLREIRLHGQTDSLILEAALSRAGRSMNLDQATSETLYRRYVELLEIELAGESAGYIVLPGVLELLDRLHERPDEYSLGLATGNLELGAWAKLKPGNLDRYFQFGGFGSDARERSELVRLAVRRSQELTGKHPKQVFVIGDTPQDIIHGKRAGAKVIAVATGGYALHELAEHSPDLLVASLEPVEPVWEFLTRND